MQKVAPGSLISIDSDKAALKAGSGVYKLENGSQFYASKVGVVRVDEVAGEVRVESANSSSGMVYPKIGSLIIGKVSKINSRHATILILVVDGVAVNSDAATTTSSDYVGIIQKSNVRLTRTDAVEIYKCFRPGDVVKAKVVSLGEMRHYILSTAANELGVVLAQSLAGNTLIPQSWEQMIDPITKEIEYRKCAKPDAPLDNGDVDVEMK